MGIISNKADFLAGLSGARAKFDECFRLKVRNVCYTLQYEITSKTPVWSGQALANYQWSVDEPIEGEALPALGTGFPGHTNSMPLGIEPRRSENQEFTDESLAKIKFDDPYRVFWLNNNDPTIGPLEEGAWPEPPLNQRSPNGMFLLGVEYTLALLETGAL